MFADAGVALPQIREGKVRALGVASKARMAAAPDIPPIAEAGVPGFDAACWQMIVAPAATPQEIVGKLHGEFAAIMALPDIRDRIEKVGLIPVVSPRPEELRRFVEAEIVRWSKVVHQAGMAGSE